MTRLSPKWDFDDEDSEEGEAIRLLSSRGYRVVKGQDMALADFEKMARGDLDTMELAEALKTISPKAIEWKRQGLSKAALFEALCSHQGRLGAKIMRGEKVTDTALEMLATVWALVGR